MGYFSHFPPPSAIFIDSLTQIKVVKYLLALVRLPTWKLAISVVQLTYDHTERSDHYPVVMVCHKKLDVMVERTHTPLYSCLPRVRHSDLCILSHSFLSVFASLVHLAVSKHLYFCVDLIGCYDNHNMQIY